MNRSRILPCGLLLAFLLNPAASPAQEPDCSNPQPPTGSIQLAGLQIRVGERLIAGPGARIEVAATDVAGAPASWTPVVGGQEVSAFPDSWTAGEQTAGAVAFDACGRRAPLTPVAFVVDVEPPAIRWEVGDRRTFWDRDLLAPDSEPNRRRIRYARTEGKPAADSWLSVAGVWQVPLPWVKHPNPSFLSRSRYPVVIINNHPQAFLAAPRTVASMDGSDANLGERLLWITAEDAGAGVERMTLRLLKDAEHSVQGLEVVEVKATDHVGNESRKEIVLRVAGPETR